MTLRERFDAVPAGTVGIEEEVLLLDPETHAPADCGLTVLERMPGDRRFKMELPASQVELITAAHPDVPAAIAELATARADLAHAAEGLALPAAGAVHPTAPVEVALNTGPSYDETVRRHGRVANRQLLGALHVHIAIGGADRTLAVFNALRSYLPELAALAAAAPFHAGEDTGFASIRPLIGGQLPRQGVPPRIFSWEEFEADLAWGHASGTVSIPSRWWWELRPHVGYGTLELRAPDVQADLEQAANVAGLAYSLVQELSARFDAGEPLPVYPSWRIAENRWAALAGGLDAQLADLETGELRPARERLAALGADVSRDAAAELRAAGVGGATGYLIAAFRRSIASQTST